MGLQHYTQDMSRIPLNYHTNVLFYTKYTHPALICRGKDGRTDGRTHGWSKNIYSIFRDKLLLLGEHVHGASSTQQRKLFEQAKSTKPSGRTLLSFKWYNCPTKKNGAILNIAHIIKNVMSSATEAELASLYLMAREAVYIRIILEELGHTQPPTPLQTENAMADGIINGKVQPKQTKDMDMRFHWLCDRECQ